MASQHSRIVEAAKMWFIPWGMLCLLWLLFVAKLSWYEVFVGMSASALATIGFRLVSSRSAVTFNPKMGWLLHIWRLPWLMLHDGWLVLRHLCNPLIRGTHHPAVAWCLPAFWRDGCDEPRRCPRAFTPWRRESCLCG
jgi:hypothetical protein